jgi:hypothetical protein
MKAWVYDRYGSPDVLRFEEVEAPAPGPEHVAIRVHAAGLNAADWHVMRADPFLVRSGSGCGAAPPDDRQLRRPGSSRPDGALVYSDVLLGRTVPRVVLEHAGSLQSTPPPPRG